MTKYPTRECAEKIAEIKKIDYIRKPPFCPLVKDSCRVDCVCFVNSIVREITPVAYQKDKYTWWYTEDPYCNNAMFIEKEIYHQ